MSNQLHISDHGEVRKYYNDAQMIFALVNPRKAILRWQRGGGKTEGPYSFRMANVAIKMPRSNNAISVPSYLKFLKDLLPGLRRGLAFHGLHENKHWVIGRPPLKGWENPFYKPDNYDYVLSFKNGAVYSLFSQDSKTKNQGVSIISHIGDEAKLLNHERIKEDILSAMRGGANLWSHLPEYRSELYTTDGYRREKDYSWAFTMEKRADKEAIEDMIALALVPEPTAMVRDMLDWARKNVFFYHKADPYVNIDALGFDYFKDAYENKSALEFLVSNMNYDMTRIEDSFYMFLDETRHGRFAASHSYYQNLEYNADKLANATCQGDTDILYDIPLELSIDFGGKMDFVTVTQYDRKANVFSLLKDFADKYEEVIIEFDRYYNHFKHKNGRVKLYYDVQGNKEISNSRMTYIQDIMAKLRALGWHVTDAQERAYNILHNTKFNIWKKVLYEGQDRDKRYPIFRYNLVNAERTALSMGNAPTKKDTNNMTKKDKKSETKKSINPIAATHLSDAVDNAVCHQLIDIYDGNNKVQWVKM